MAKMHLFDRASESNADIKVSVCGFIAAPCTQDKKLVTCKLCVRQADKNALAYKPVAWVPRSILVIDRPQWGTWRHAFQSYINFKDDGYPMKSTSDPGRFGTMGGTGGKATADGDRAQTIAGDLAIVGKLYGEAFAAPFILESGEPIEGYTASRIFEYRICGRDRELDGKRLPRRVEWPVADLIQAINDVGVATVSAGDIAQILAAGIAHIEDGLHARGLVSFKERGRN